MNSKSLDGIAVFVAVVDTGGFSAAAKQLGHSTSYVSKVVGRLEQRLGVRLLNRTTRSISLTNVGQAFYTSSRTMLDIAQDATSLATEQQENPRGKLRINVPVSFGLTHLAGVLPKFLMLYPGIILEVEFNDRMVDVVAEGYDLAIRIGHLKDSSLIARKLTTSRGVVVASPAYWDKHGRPEHPNDLAAHNCISYSNMANPSQWDFRDANGNHLKVKVNCNVICNSAELETALAVAGSGVTRLPAFACKQEIDSGALEIVLLEFEAKPLGLFAIYPHRAHLPAKVRVFVDYMFQTLNE